MNEETALSLAEWLVKWPQIEGERVGFGRILVQIPRLLSFVVRPGVCCFLSLSILCNMG